MFSDSPNNYFFTPALGTFFKTVFKDYRILLLATRCSALNPAPAPHDYILLWFSKPAALVNIIRLFMRAFTERACSRSDTGVTAR